MKAIMMRTHDEWIKRRLPEQARNNERVFCLFKSCLAPMIYHKHWVKLNLNEENPSYSSLFLSEDIPFAEDVKTAFPWTKIEDTPTFSGIPADVVYLAKNEEASPEGKHGISELNNKRNNSLDSQGIEGE